MKKIVVLASGEGSNFSAIVKSGIKVDMLITDNKNANVIKRAEKVDVPVFVFDRKEGDRKYGHGWSDGKIGETIPEDVSLIVLAGYMRIIPPVYVKKWINKIINIHPSLLPAFGGGCKVFGVTVHWVDEGVDTGPIIAQKSIYKLDSDTLELITDRIRKVEHNLYPKTIKELISR
jgi:phosphoribosylglycinamide formyltransferase-1